jgi:hypothetical protein
MTGHCMRCHREMQVTLDEFERVVCTGCLTAEEDLRETEAVIAVMRRWEASRLPDRDAAEQAEGVIETVLDNLDRRIHPRPAGPPQRQDEPGAVADPTWSSEPPRVP